jgi:hypothetical protein
MEHQPDVRPHVEPSAEALKETRERLEQAGLSDDQVAPPPDRDPSAEGYDLTRVQREALVLGPRASEPFTRDPGPVEDNARDSGADVLPK